jgi:hypothetical protein
VFNQPFLQITLPLMVTFVAATSATSWRQNRRLDDIIRRLEKIEDLLQNHDRRITALEERTSPFARR